MAAVTIAALNSKGGVGKTFTVANTAAALAELGLAVGMIDFDPQGDLSASWGVDEGDLDLMRVHDFLADPTRDPHEGFVELPAPGSGTLRLLAADVRLAELSARLQGGRGRDLAFIVERVADNFDVLVIDTPASETVFSAQAVVAATEALVPILPGFNEMRALYRVLDRIDAMAADHATEIHLLGVLLCNTDQRWRTAKEAIEALGTDGLDVFTTVIPRRQPVADHPRYGVPTLLLKPDDVLSEAYRNVAREALDRLSLSIPVRA